MVISENPKTKSDNIIAKIGIVILNHLLLNIKPENKANDVIGVKFGKCGINLNQIAIKINRINKFSFCFILFVFYYVIPSVPLFFGKYLFR